MAFDKKQQIRGTRILLTVFYGFLLSSIISSYIVHGIVETIRRPTNAFSITMIILGTIILITIGLALYATWYDNALIMLVSGAVLIFVFILTLVFGIVRIINTAPHRVIHPPPISNAVADVDGSSNAVQPILADKATNKSDTYALAEDVTKLIIELVMILIAILGTFILQRYVKAKYAAVPTAETK